MSKNNTDLKIIGSAEIQTVIAKKLSPYLKGKNRSLIIIPDATRTLPLHVLFPIINQIAFQNMCHVDYLIALGTHPPLAAHEIEILVGKENYKNAEIKYGTKIFNHDWKNSGQLSCIGIISREEVSEITGGILDISIPISINKLVQAYDQLIVCGPVFPHEVAGFSGGEKYFFPGIAGEEIIHITHWLGALTTSMDTIGNRNTLVRKILRRASCFIQQPIINMAFCLKEEDVYGIFIGEMEDTWTKATKLSAKLNITYVPQLFESVVSIPSNKYNELWTAAKAMYKLEPVVADGGKLIIYAPHLHTISVTHEKHIRRIGYHVKDYFIHQWEQYKDFPWAVLAHSTHLKGKGRYRAGIEKPRINVILATGIPENICQEINLDYMHPNSINLSDWENSGNKLVVYNAGENLYRYIEDKIN